MAADRTTSGARAKVCMCNPTLFTACCTASTFAASTTSTAPLNSRHLYSQHPRPHLYQETSHINYTRPVTSIPDCNPVSLKRRKSIYTKTSKPIPVTSLILQKEEKQALVLGTQFQDLEKHVQKTHPHSQRRKSSCSDRPGRCQRNAESCFQESHI